MKVIKPYTQIFDDSKEQNILKKIERVGRTCYKSEGKIDEGSAEKFVTNIIKRGHEAVLEHASFIIEVGDEFYHETQYVINDLEEKSDFVSFLRFTNDSRPIISGNVRAWRDFFKAVVTEYMELPGCAKKFIKDHPLLFPEFQNVYFKEQIYDDNVFKTLKTSDLVTTNEKLTHWDLTVKFVVDRGVSHEIVRHRPASYAQESTRYCNYSKDDFGCEITFIEPFFLEEGTIAWNYWVNSCQSAESAYFGLLEWGCTPQEARAVLPNSLKTELVMTVRLGEWRHFFKLRAANATGKAHPQMLEVARPLLDDVIKLIPVVFDDIRY